jgi:hypothetical protein
MHPALIVGLVAATVVPVGAGVAQVVVGQKSADEMKENSEIYKTCQSHVSYGQAFVEAPSATPT